MDKINFLVDVHSLAEDPAILKEIYDLENCGKIYISSSVLNIFHENSFKGYYGNLFILNDYLQFCEEKVEIVDVVDTQSFILGKLNDNQSICFASNEYSRINYYLSKFDDEKFSGYYLSASKDRLETDEATGFLTLEVEKEIIDNLFLEKFVLQSAVPELGNLTTFPNQFFILKNKNSTSCLARLYQDRLILVDNKGKVYSLTPASKEQRFAANLLLDTSIQLVSLIGRAGSGKSILALAAGLEGIQKKQYDKLLIVKPTVAVGKELGFLPGDLEEKLDPWMEAIRDNIQHLSKDEKLSYEMLTTKGMLELQAVQLIRGRSIDHTYMIVDEAQNMSLHELKTVITRAGKGTKIVLTGDLDQIDLKLRHVEVSGLEAIVKRFLNESIAGHIMLSKVERSNLADIAAKIL